MEQMTDAANNDMQAHILEEQEKNRKYEKARTEIIAGISHDLRTPLTAIRGSIKAILDGVVREEKQKEKFLTTAYRRTGEMDVLLNQLFYISKLETGNMPLNTQKTDLFFWISEYIRGKRESLGTEEVEFNETLEHPAGEACIDREFELLKFLAMNPNIVFSKEQLFEKIWGYDYIGDSATVMVHINRIRDKIEDDTKNPKILQTVWGRRLSSE